MPFPSLNSNKRGLGVSTSEQSKKPSCAEVRFDIDDSVEELDREIELLGIDRGPDPPHQQIGGIAG